MKRSWLSWLLNGSRRHLPGRGRPLRLSQVVFLSTPLLLFGLYFGGGAVLDYVQMKQFDDWWSRGAHADNLFIRRVQVALNGPRAATISQRLDVEAPDAAIVRLDIPKDQWAALQRDKQTTWGVWLDVGLVRGDVPEPVRIRRRGDTSVHWTTEKMSFTLRTPGSAPFRGYRNLAFSVADVLPQYVALALAQDFDLLAPNTMVAPLFVNGRYYGIYQVTETVDDEFLANHGQLPGVIYQGDAAERGDVYAGVPRGLFMNPYIWEFAAGDDDSAPADRSRLNSFVEDLSDNSFDAHLRLMSRLDREEIARLVALLLVTGDPYHMDNLHNQFWYADPASSRLHPIPWDVRLLELSKPTIWVNRFLKAALRDPFVVDAALRETHAALESGLVARAEELARTTYERFRPHFDYDRLRAGVIADVGTPDDVVKPLRANQKLLREWMTDAKVAFQAAAVDNVVVMDLETRGYAGANLVGLELQAAIPAMRIVADRNGNGQLDAQDPTIPGSWSSANGAARFNFTQPEALLAGWDTRGKGIAAGAVHYRVFLTGASAAHASAVKPVLLNRVTGQQAQTQSLAAGTARTASLSFSPWQFAVERGSTMRWAGTMDVRETVRIGANDTLVIAPGTMVRLHPEASIISQGLVLARGQADAPITFAAVDAERPWGAFALQGANANGSQITHARFSGGGGALIEGTRYTGMVNVHHARDVVFDGIDLRDNLRSDDAFHASHADAVLRNCTASNTNADAVSYDYSTGEIRNCRIERAGSDAIDLVGSSPRILGNQLIGAVERGIAIDGSSAPVIFNNRVTDSGVGIDARGGALVRLFNNLVAKNAVGLLQDQAGGRGAWVKQLNNAIDGNVSETEIDQSARTTELEANKPTTAAVQNLLLLANGLRVNSGNAGLVTSWTDVAPLSPLDHQQFEENITSLADGWQPYGGVLRLEKRDGMLLSTLEKRRGGMRRAVDWNLQRDSALLILEIAGRDVDAVNVNVLSATGPITQRVTISATFGFYRYVSVKLPPGQYSEVALEAMPRSSGWEIDPRTGFLELRNSRLELAGYWLLPIQKSATGVVALGASK